MGFSDSSWKDCLDTGISIEAYIIFYQGGTIDHFTNVPGPVDQSSAESEYNAECTSGMDFGTFQNVDSWTTEQGSRHIYRGSSFGCLR